MITKYEGMCIICGKRATDCHHLLYGTANRKLSDQDDLTIPLCKEHHLGDKSVHKQKELMIMAQIIGQLAYEKKRCAEGMTEDEARESFRMRYGRCVI